MDDTTPTTPNDPKPTPPVAVPDPHAGEPSPPTQEGMRPEAAANALARPEQDEESGPLAGLVTASAAQVSAESTPNSDPSTDADAALLESMGVEEEGIESGQLLGLVASVIVAVAALAVVLIFLFYLPFLQQVDDTAANVGLYPELEQVRTDGRLKTEQYALVDSVYRVPVENAMSLVTARYRQNTAAPAGLPSTHQQWNTLMVNRGTGTTVQTPRGAQRRASAENESLSAESGGLAGTTNEEVGVDDRTGASAPTTLETNPLETE